MFMRLHSVLSNFAISLVIKSDDVTVLGPTKRRRKQTFNFRALMVESLMKSGRPSSRSAEINGRTSQFRWLSTESLRSGNDWRQTFCSDSQSRHCNALPHRYICPLFYCRWQIFHIHTIRGSQRISSSTRTTLPAKMLFRESQSLYQKNHILVLNFATEPTELFNANSIHHSAVSISLSTNTAARDDLDAIIDSNNE